MLYQKLKENFFFQKCVITIINTVMHVFENKGQKRCNLTNDLTPMYEQHPWFWGIPNFWDGEHRENCKKVTYSCVPNTKKLSAKSWEGPILRNPFFFMGCQGGCGAKPNFLPFLLILLISCLKIIAITKIMWPLERYFWGL